MTAHKQNVSRCGTRSIRATCSRSRHDCGIIKIVKIHFLSQKRACTQICSLTSDLAIPDRKAWAKSGG